MYEMNKNLFITPSPNPEAKIRLFCFPYAGGSSAIFTPWLKLASKDIELVLVQLPGRGARLAEPTLDNMALIIEELMAHQRYITSQPFAFFGHSLGSRIAYELALQLQQKGLPLPQRIFASASRAPHCISNKPIMHNLPHNEFIAELEKLNGTPKEVLENTELMELLLPLLRADFKVAETYVAKRHSLPIPIHVFNGQEDEIKQEEIEAWQEITQQPVELTHFPGGHFFIHQHADKIIDIINSQLQSQKLHKSPLNA